MECKHSPWTSVGLAIFWVTAGSLVSFCAGLFVGLFTLGYRMMVSVGE